VVKQLPRLKEIGRLEKLLKKPQRQQPLPKQLQMQELKQRDLPSSLKKML